MKTIPSFLLLLLLLVAVPVQADEVKFGFGKYNKKYL